MNTSITWSQPFVISVALLVLAVFNFALSVVLERYSRRLSVLTLPALLSEVGLVLLFLIAGAINRFFMDFGYMWLLPALMVALAVSFGAIFTEKKLALKCQLAFNTLAMALLWALGQADKIDLPF